ncbi:hypothetical protein GGTG_02700 [Gaeumannomyces tritici R3-111a-1]|uniref:Uncharacterized protein n=1 Tax=Gaeumannomyces tritici (strain R3-111a-1) TaxID=644352 RepID=J3NN42_GAET3|nr:hypothetical protein GGTG_02700 [Gaeumannomyces tritici R3-111a-1]EJT77594.1 hypothetical protein GGTG_02700 [Gaeumannomyces tritici R3-111a-1]
MERFRRKNSPKAEASSSSERSRSRFKFWRKDKRSEEASISPERSHSHWNFGRQDRPGGDASSSSERSSSRGRLSHRQERVGSSSVQPASLGHELGSEVTITGRPRSSQVVDEARSPSIPAGAHEPAATEAKPIVPSGPCVTNANAASSTSLWDHAYEALRKEKPEVVQDYEELLLKVAPYLANTHPTTDLNDVLFKASNDLANAAPNSGAKTVEPGPQSGVDRQKMMADVIDSGQKHMEEKQIAFKIGQQKFVLQDQVEHVVAGIQLGKDWIDGAVQASPLAGAAWAGVCLLLPLLTNPGEVQAANKQGLAYVSQKISYYTSMEPLILHAEDPTDARWDHLRSRLLGLYQAIIDFQAQSVLRFFRRRFANFLREVVKYDPWEDMLEKIKVLGRDVESESMQINIAVSREALGKLVQWARESEEDECLQSFRRGDYAWYKDRIELRVPDTCLWFLNHESYQSWLADDSGPLLVSADPGCGKSVLARYLIDSRLGFTLPKDAAICYFFFKDQDQNTIELALCALIHQLLCLRPKLMHHALPRYKQDGAGLANNVTALWDILKSATADPEAGTVVIVLDALDECLQDERNMQTLSRYIHDHFEKRRGNLKILMTSRPYEGTVQHIQDLEKAFPNIRIKGEDESETIREEINSVIEHRVHQMDKFSDDLKAHLRTRLTSITHRTYLWLYLVFEHLKGPDVKQTARGLDRSLLEDLPKTVDEAYEGILSRSKAPQVTRKAILILLGAYRPLNLREVQIALELAPDTVCPGSLDLEPDQAFKRRLRECCGLFVTVHDDKVYFLHQTAREFLLPLAASSPGPAAPPIWAHTFSIRQAHTVLAESCTVYLDRLNHQADADPTADLLDYSAENWGAHFREAGIVDDAAVIPFALRICDPKSESYSKWSDIYWISLHWLPPKSTTNLTLPSHFGHDSAVKLLLSTGKVDIDSGDNRGQTPLSWAAESGHEAVVKLLFDTGEVDINSSDNAGQTPLLLAARCGHEAVVKFLLNTGKIDINSRDNGGQTPLSCAVENGHEAVVKLLLDTGNVDIHSRNNKGQTPLSLAAYYGREAVVKLLLDTGKVDVDSRDNKGQTPLLLAAKNKLEAVVKLLLDTGKVDVDSRNNRGQTPLLLAAYYGYEAVVKLLLDTGKADIDSRDKRGRTPLSWAIECGHEAVVKLLQGQRSFAS